MRIQELLKGLAVLGYKSAKTISDFIASKGQASGLASLDAGGKIPITQLSPTVITSVSTVASEAAQLALTVQVGDVAIRTDESKSYIHNGGTAGSMDDWTQIVSPTGANLVISVNGETGEIVLDADDIDDTSTTNKFTTASEKNTWDAKQDALTPGTDYVDPDLDSVFNVGVGHDAEVDNGDSDTAKTIDFTTGNMQKITLTDDCTFTFTPPATPRTCKLKLISDGTGRTLTFPSMHWVGDVLAANTGTSGEWHWLMLIWDGAAWTAQATTETVTPA